MKKNRENYLIKNYIFNYLVSVRPDIPYLCKDNGISYLFFSEKNYLFCVNKDFIGSIAFSEVHIEWNDEFHFPIIKKDDFNKLDGKELTNYVNGHIATSTKIKNLLRIDED